MRSVSSKTADDARLARLERAGIIRRGRPISRKFIDKKPVTPASGASALEALLEERRSGR